MAFVELNGKRSYLGKYRTSASKQEYRRFIVEWMANGRATNASGNDISVVDLISAFGVHAKRHYRLLDGSPSRERVNYRSVLAMLKKLYGHTAVSDFTPMALKALREQMIANGWSRKNINRQVVRLRSVFKWGLSEGLVPVDIYTALCAVAGLQAGRTETRESDPIPPVSDDAVIAIIPHVSPIVA